MLKLHSKNVYVIHYSNIVKAMALSIFQNIWVDTNFKMQRRGPYLSCLSCNFKIKRIGGLIAKITTPFGRCVTKIVRVDEG